MIVFCEECGEKYIVEPTEKSAALIFICNVCNEIIRVKMPAASDKNSAESGHR